MPKGIHLSEEIQKEIFEQYKNNIKISLIAKNLNLTYSGVHRVLKLYNIELSREKLNKKQISEFLDDYYNNHFSNKELQEKYEISSAPICHYFNKYGTGARPEIYKYARNEEFFDFINSEEKCWLLGWIWSDGFNSNKYFNIVAHKQDREVLEKFQKILDGAIYKCSSQNCFEFRVVSQKLCKRLTEIGCMRKKSLIVDWPKLDSNQQYWWFLRGLFEGDGGITERLGKNPGAMIASAAPKLTEKLKLFLESYKFKININKFPNHSCSKINIGGGAKEVIRFLDLLYKDASETLRLKRKYELYLKVKNLVGNPPDRLDSNAHRYKTIYLLKEGQYYSITGLRRFAQDMGFDDIKFEKQFARWKRNNYKKKISFKGYEFIQKIPENIHFIEKDYRNIPIPYKFTRAKL